MRFKTRELCQAAIIAALYFVFTVVWGELAVVPFFQIRPAEALTILPILIPAAIPGVTIGCMLVNLVTSSPIDMLIGGVITLVAAILSRKIQNPFFAPLPPIFLNAFGLPMMFTLMGYETAYWTVFASILLSETVWIYGLGLPLFFFIRKLIEKDAIHVS